MVGILQHFSVLVWQGEERPEFLINRLRLMKSATFIGRVVFTPNDSTALVRYGLWIQGEVVSHLEYYLLFLFIFR